MPTVPTVPQCGYSGGYCEILLSEWLRRGAPCTSGLTRVVEVMAAKCKDCKLNTHSTGSPDCPARRIGTVLDGRFRLESLIGVGGMGAVYLAIQLTTARQVAIKMLLPLYNSEADLIRRFKREAQVLASLNEKTIVDIRDFSSESEDPYFVMEYLEGTSLSKFERAGRFRLKYAVVIALELLQGLKAAHAKDIVHRDMKPSNIMILQRTGQRPRIRILDFGLAKAAEEARITRTGMVAGTPHYMAPEQYDDLNKVDSRADLFSLGATLFTLICKSEIVSGTSELEIMKALTSGKHMRHPRLIRPAVPEWLDEWVARALDPDLNCRYQRAEEMEEALRTGLKSTHVWDEDGEESIEPFEDVPIENLTFYLPAKATEFALNGHAKVLSATTSDASDIGANSSSDMNALAVTERRDSFPDENRAGQTHRNYDSATAYRRDSLDHLQVCERLLIGTTIRPPRIAGPPLRPPPRPALK